MAEIPKMVKHIEILANAGVFGNPRNSNFMNSVSKEIFENVSSPIKAAAFATFYKQLEKKCTPKYKTFQMKGTSVLKKQLKAQKGKKGGKASPKEETNLKKATLAAKAAKNAYFLSMYGLNYIPPKKAKKGKKSSVKYYSPVSSTTSKSAKSSKSVKSSKSSHASEPSKTSSASSASSYQSNMSR